MPIGGHFVTMKVDTSYKFYVIQFLQSPFKNVDDYVCVPSTWLEDRGSKGIYAAYPSERLPTTRNIVKSRQDYDKEWKFYLCIPKYGTNCPWDAENIIRVESSKKLNSISPQVPSKQSGSEENKPKTKPKMNTRDELTQSLKRKVSIDSRNRKTARIETTSDVPEPTGNLLTSENKSAFCKDLAGMRSRLPELLITKSQVFDLTGNEEETPSNTSHVEQMLSHHSETGTSSKANHRRKSAPETVDSTITSSLNSSLQVLKETRDSVNNRRNSTSTRPSSQPGQLPTNTTKNPPTTSSMKKLTDKVIEESILSKTEVNRPLQNNLPAKTKERRSSVRKSTELNTLNNTRLLQELIMSGGLKDVDNASLQNCLKYVQEIAQETLVAPSSTQTGLVVPQAMQAAQATPSVTQAMQVAPQAAQAKQDMQTTLQAITQVANKQAQKINNSPGIPYPITANAPILYQDPHERQITTEISTVSKIIDSNYSQTRAHNASNVQNVSNLQYFPNNNQIFGMSQQRQAEQQIAANGNYTNQFSSSSSIVSGRVSDGSYTTCRPSRPKNSVPLNAQMPNSQQHYAAFGPNMPQISKTTGPKNQMPSNTKRPILPHKMPPTCNWIHTVSKIPNPNYPECHRNIPNHPHSYNDRNPEYNYSHSEAQLLQDLLQKIGTGHKHPSLGVPMSVNTQNHLLAYPPNAANQLRQLQSAHVNNAVMPQAYTNHPNQVPQVQVQENITVRPRSNDTTQQVPQRHDMPHDIATAVQQISNSASNSNDNTNSADILNNSNPIATNENMKEKTDETRMIIENEGEKALSVDETSNTNMTKTPCHPVEKLPACNEITDEECHRSSSADTVKIDQIPNDSEDVLTELTNKINYVLSPTFRAQIEINLIKDFGKILQIMSNNFDEILEVLNRDQKMIMEKKEMLDKALTSIASYLELQNENPANVLRTKHSASQNVIKKKKNKKRRIKDADDDVDECNYSSDDSDSHDSDRSDGSDGNDNNNEGDTDSNNEDLDGKKGSLCNDNKHSEGKTSKTKDDKKITDGDGNSISKSDSNNRNEDTKRRGKKHPFVLPREYSPTNPRWTLIYQSAAQGTIELLPKTRIYVNASKLANYKRISSSYKEFASMVLTLIFSRSALSVCSWTGARANAFAVDKNDVRPGLDENARQVMLNYVERVGRKKNWGKYDEQSIVNSLRAKIQSVRKLNNKKLINKE
ncbi:putative uncharacterized protein DDB_G0291608 isoform X1 [Spodoptera frugiperda]|uniref:BEN domain-containing protein n=2 Tax=Spodoptera frugiperda TaxID=7108 RepID=A0A9R0DH51_SPOFR|nr:putative uncharacterized protein DDB_G0291608 isoform X1 [Spodoptera frugiperda]